MVFDTTKYLPNEPHDGKTKYAEAHVPGADYFDIDLIADPDSDAAAHDPERRRASRS